MVPVLAMVSYKHVEKAGRSHIAHSRSRSVVQINFCRFFAWWCRLISAVSVVQINFCRFFAWWCRLISAVSVVQINFCRFFAWWCRLISAGLRAGAAYALLSSLALQEGNVGFKKTERTSRGCSLLQTESSFFQCKWGPPD